MAKRGEDLRQHILWTAKNVFLEGGFERTSMDVIAQRAETSKRTLYAHFESKEKLFLEIVELVRSLFLAKLKDPGEYGAEPVQALALFFELYLRWLLYRPIIQWCRVSVAEAARFPEGARQYFDVIFSEVQRRLSAYLVRTFGLREPRASALAEELLGRVIHPWFERALFGMDAPLESFEEHAAPAEAQLKLIRVAVAEVLMGVETRKDV